MQLSRLLQIPFTSLSCQFRFHDYHVLRPANFHRQPEEHLVIFVSPIKIAHPAHVAWGKACAVREIRLQKFCGCDRCSLLRALANSFADDMNFVHLRKILRKNCGQFPVHRAVIYRFSDVHSFSFPRCCAHHVLCFSVDASLRPCEGRVSPVSKTKTRLSINGIRKAGFI